MIYFILAIISIHILVVIWGIQNSLNKKFFVNLLQNHPLGLPEILKYTPKDEVTYIWDNYQSYTIICSIKFDNSNDLSKIKNVKYFVMTQNDSACLVDFDFWGNDYRRSSIIKSLLISSVVSFTNENIKEGNMIVTNEKNMLELEEFIKLQQQK